MNSKDLIGLVFLGLILATSCQKKALEELSLSPSTYPNFAQLALGNYWIYERYRVDSSGQAQALQILDSCYVEKDTLINGRSYFKVFRPNPHLPPSQHYSYLRDSLHYLVNAQGDILFSAQNFSDIFKREFVVLLNQDTVCEITTQMTDQDLVVHSPAGAFPTYNFRQRFSMYPRWASKGNPRDLHTRYAQGVGIVSEVLPFFTDSPGYTEWRLRRYRVN